jgi:RNA polymerase sigma factor (TIGR02999 family)
MEQSYDQLPELLRRAGEGDAAATDAILGLVYDDLKKLAAWHMSRERGGGAGHTLGATALVHEAYLRMLKGRDGSWADRRHFFNAAALAMRRILVERARRKSSRGQFGLPMGSDVVEPAAVSDGEAEPDWVLIDRAVESLQGFDPELAEIVQLRFFAGLSVEQAAQALGVSTRTVDRRWRIARAWLAEWMSRESGEPRSGEEGSPPR